jgi:hypothetical protein
MPEDETRNSKSRKEKQVSRHPDDLREERAIVLRNVLAGNPAQSIPSCQENGCNFEVAFQRPPKIMGLMHTAQADLDAAIGGCSLGGPLHHWRHHALKQQRQSPFS